MKGVFSQSTVSLADSHNTIAQIQRCILTEGENRYASGSLPKNLKLGSPRILDRVGR